jgi:hypothetical protein
MLQTFYAGRVFEELPRQKVQTQMRVRTRRRPSQPVQEGIKALVEVIEKRRRLFWAEQPPDTTDRTEV